MSLLPVMLHIVDEPFAKTCGAGSKPYDFGSGVHGVDLHLHHERRNSGIMEWLGYSRPTSIRRKSRDSGNGDRPAAATETLSPTSEKSHVGKEGFQVFLDVEHFAPNEITVKTIESTIVIEGKHEEREDEHGDIYRHFIRRYQIPGECNVNEVLATLSSDGILTIKVPFIDNENTERSVPIHQTGPAVLNVKPNPKNDGKVEKMTE